MYASFVSVVWECWLFIQLLVMAVANSDTMTLTQHLLLGARMAFHSSIHWPFGCRCISFSFQLCNKEYLQYHDMRSWEHPIKSHGRVGGWCCILLCWIKPLVYYYFTVPSVSLKQRRYFHVIFYNCRKPTSEVKTYMLSSQSGENKIAKCHTDGRYDSICKLKKRSRITASVI